MANKGPALQAGYGNGGIEPMDQFDKLSDKISNSLKNLEFTRDMLRQLADNERKSAKSIATILNQKNKSLRFSVVDQAIQNYWKKQESNRRHFAEALQTKIVDELHNFISAAADKKKKLTKENSKIQRNFIECKKETIKLKQIGLKEWQKLEEQINKNDQHKKTNKLQKIKDLKPLQDKCSKAFNKYELYILKLNELEQINHEQCIQIGKTLHESQEYASNRLSMHYNMTVSSKKFMDDFIAKNKSIVQSKAPPLNDILWRWLTYPKNHQAVTTLPCSSKQVLNKNEIGQQFKRRVGKDYQESKYLQAPIVHNESKENASNTPRSPQQSNNNNNNNKISKKKKKEKKEKKKKKKNNVPVAVAVPVAVVDDKWDVDFGDVDFGDDGQQIDDKDKDKNVFENKESEHKESDNNAFDNTAFGNTDFANNDFGDDTFGNDNTDTFDIDIDIDNKENKDDKEKDNADVDSKDANFNNFGFDDNFADFNDGNKDLEIVNDNATNGASFGIDSHWNTNFDENAFAVTDNNNNNANNQQDIDALFAASEANDIFATTTTTTTTTINGDDNNNNKKKKNDALFPDDFGGDGFDFDAVETRNDVIDAGKGSDNDININSDGGGGGGGLFDDEFDDADDQEIQFPEFDINAKPIATKKGKSKVKKKKKVQQAPQSQASPQPNEITSIPEAVISFDAPIPIPIDNDNDNDNDDNPFGDDDPFGGDNNNHNGADSIGDDIDEDNPFAMFDEPDGNDDDNNNDTQTDDPFAM